MNDNPFFKPTPLYKEFMILDLIEKNPSLTQREIGDAIGVAVSMVNAYLDEYEEKGYGRNGDKHRTGISEQSCNKVCFTTITNHMTFLKRMEHHGFKKVFH
jgi:predicted transcriptional regulator